MENLHVANHPNRNWRARMRAAADQWLTTSEARVLIEVPVAHGKTDAALRQRIRDAYEAGYADGRKSR